MMDDGGVDANVTLGNLVRSCAVVSSWDQSSWQSDTSNTVRVSAVTGGRTRGWSHAQKAQRSGATLPATPPAPVALDFGALVRRAVVQTGTRAAPRF